MVNGCLFITNESIYYSLFTIYPIKAIHEITRSDTKHNEVSMDLNDINQLFNYTEWANNLAMEAAAKLPDESLRRDVCCSHQSIFGTLLHMAGAEWIWLERWHGRSPSKAEAWSQWTTESCADLAALRERWMEVMDRRWKYVSELDDARLTSELPFTGTRTDRDSMKGKINGGGKSLVLRSGAGSITIKPSSPEVAAR